MAKLEDSLSQYKITDSGRIKINSPYFKTECTVNSSLCGLEILGAFGIIVGTTFIGYLANEPLQKLVDYLLKSQQ